MIVCFCYGYGKIHTVVVVYKILVRSILTLSFWETNYQNGYFISLNDLNGKKYIDCYVM